MIDEYEIRNIGFNSYYDSFNKMINNPLLASLYNLSSNFAVLKGKTILFSHTDFVEQVFRQPVYV